MGTGAVFPTVSAISDDTGTVVEGASRRALRKSRPHRRLVLPILLDYDVSVPSLELQVLQHNHRKGEMSPSQYHQKCRLLMSRARSQVCVAYIRSQKQFHHVRLTVEQCVRQQCLAFPAHSWSQCVYQQETKMSWRAHPQKKREGHRRRVLTSHIRFHKQFRHCRYRSITLAREGPLTVGIPTDSPLISQAIICSGCAGSDDRCSIT